MVNSHCGVTGDYSMKNHSNNNQTDSRDSARIGDSQEGEDHEAVAVPSNTATNNSNNDNQGFQLLRFGVDSLYLSYQGELFKDVDKKLNDLKRLAQFDRADTQAKAQYKIGDHLFEVKDKGTSMFSYVLEDNAFRIQLARPEKAVPMAYIKVSSEYLTYKKPADAEKALYKLLKELGKVQSTANVSRVDLFVDFVSTQDMEAWDRNAWVTRAGSVNSYAVDGRFTGWAVGMGGVIAARLYDKLYEISKSNKDYLIPLWEMMGRKEGDPVWRLEFEFKRDFLKQKDIIPLSEALTHLNGLWSYATTEWLKLTIPNHEDETRSRWPIHPLWQALASIDWETSGGPLKSRFSNERSPDKKIAMHRAFTALTTWMAIEKQHEYDLAIHPFYEDLYFYINNLAMNMGMDFDQLMREKVAFKARHFNTIDVNQEIYEAYVDEEVAAYRKASDGE
jgi:hypothetical protein